MIRFNPRQSLYDRCFFLLCGSCGLIFACGIFLQGEFTYNARFGDGTHIRRSESPLVFWATVCACALAGTVAILSTFELPALQRYRGLRRFGMTRAGLHPLPTLAAAVFFLVPGLFISWQLIERFHEMWRLREAVEVPATVVSLDLNESASRKSRTLVAASYTFLYGGERYVSDKLAVFANGVDLYERLKAAKDKGETVTCFVDPADPTLSVFDRSFSMVGVLLSLLFAVPFSLIGIALFWCSFRNAIILYRRR